MAELFESCGKFIVAVGWPVAFGVFACILFWKALAWLDKQWDKRETRITDLTTRVDKLANGQRQALEKVANEAAGALAKSNEIQVTTNEVLTRIASAMDSWTQTIRHCKEQSEITEEELDAKAAARVARRAERERRKGET